MSLENIAIGLGVDTHRFKEGGPLVLGGVEIPFDKSLDAHSDGDVLLHAILDAVLSAADQPDLGTLFPDTDEANRGRSSVVMAQEVARRLNVAGARILSLDAVVICEQPRIAPLRAQLRESVASMFDIRMKRVNVKGKTAEGMGAIGRGEGIECRTVVLVERGQSQ
ncbi:MAG: 2-C-methyl-D-erythritol 2,4-cyclodiphosphate synthase [Planctomycetota bacterium]|jgi:2-C-methyl-D-erythritol 2,4-cyclodiphosphate synthase|nr:2-C-methyl-D-erythritol 2,4-cyclodiphosphate synthase [Planctomycetota bacterium]